LARNALVGIRQELSGARGAVAVPIGVRLTTFLAAVGRRLLLRGQSQADLAFQRFLDSAFAGEEVPFALRRRLLAAFRTDHLGLRRLAIAWAGSLVDGGPELALARRVRSVWNNPRKISQELLTLRALQTLAMVDIHTYRQLVFELGGFEAEGEAAPAPLLP
jgi:hypothetical protein